VLSGQGRTALVSACALHGCVAAGQTVGEVAAAGLVGGFCSDFRQTSPGPHVRGGLAFWTPGCTLCQAVMSVSLLLCFGHIVDWAAKVALLATLGREPALWAHAVVLAAVHVVANAHNTSVFFRAVPRLHWLAVPPLVLLFGFCTPLMQVLHICDAVAAWWVSQDMTGRNPLRVTPLDMVGEGLVFMLVTLHLHLSLMLGYIDPALLVLPGLPVIHGVGLHLENLLSIVLGFSLVSVATALVIWDTSVSLKLSRDMYGWPGQRLAAGGVSCGGQFLAHLAFRGSEVAGKSVLLAALAVLLGSGCALKYAVGSYLLGFVGLLALSPRKAPVTASPRDTAAPPEPVPVAVPTPWPIYASTVIAWPLLFANLPQFVDCPRHATGASHLAGVICSFRALELAVALSAMVVAVLIEDELLDLGPKSGYRLRGASRPEDGTLLHGLRLPGLGLGFDGSAAGGASELVRAWRVLYDRSNTLFWAFCMMLHYLCMVTRWCCWNNNADFVVHGSTVHGSAVHGSEPGRLPRAPRSGTRSPVLFVRAEKDFWPPALGLAPLLLAAACERAPLAWPFDGSASSTAAGLGGSLLRSGRGGGPLDRQLRVEDFDTLRVIGSGEFGKVFQVRQRSTQEIFAMKRLSKEFYSRRRMTDKAIREIATLHLARDHPFVVRLMYTIENAREWALVMEYCPHGDLQQLLLAEGCPGLPLSRTLKLSAEVALALEHLHARGIVFRDLKLENVVLDKDGHAKLTDFGLAKQHPGGRDAITEAELAGDVYSSFTKTFCGSYGYAAPEVNPRRQVHGFAADMYSFGVLMLMLLMGGEVYHDPREHPSERRLPPETPKDLRNTINQLTFEFYWGSHHFLSPAGASHRVEVNMNGNVVLFCPRGARRQERPRRPPNSPRTPPNSPRSRGIAEGEPRPGTPELDLDAAGGSVAPVGALAGAGGKGPSQFPALALAPCEAAQRRWDQALDLIRVLTHEFPEQRGTVARVKQHAFFAEEIPDWRMVYPKSWLIERVRAKLLQLFGWASLPQRWEQQLQRLSCEELTSLQDQPEVYVELLEQAVSSSAGAEPTMQSEQDAPVGASGPWGSTGSAATPGAGGAGSRASSRHSSLQGREARSRSSSAGGGHRRQSSASSAAAGGGQLRQAPPSPSVAPQHEWVAHYEGASGRF